MTQQDSPQEVDLTQYKPLLDQLTAYVTECSGYELFAEDHGLVCAEFKFPGGKFPLAINPTKPFADNVKLLRTAVQLNVFMARLPVIKPLWDWHSSVTPK